MKRGLFKKNVVWVMIFTIIMSLTNQIGVSADEEAILEPVDSVSGNVYESVYEIKPVKSYLVKFKDSVDSDVFLGDKKIKKSKKKKFSSSNSLNLSLTDSEYLAIKNDSNILQIESDGQVIIESVGPVQKSHTSVKKMKKDDETIPWGIKAIGGEITKDQKITGKSIKVGVIDTGISNHPDLEIVGGVSFVEGSSSYSDNNGHGTHIAGTIAATDNKFGVVGIAPKVDLYAIKVLGADGTGSYSQVVQGIEWAISNKMDIINLSFGGTESSEILHAAIAQAEKAGLIVVAAAGNLGKGSETEMYPALYPEVISVGATTSTNQRAEFSSTGSNLGIMAPGSQILSTTMDGEYGVLSGTSMAAPHVTGAAALVLSKNKKMKNKEVKKLLYDSATPLGESSEFGKGLLNVAKALGLTNQPIPPVDDAQNSQLDEATQAQLSAMYAEDDKLTILSEKLLSLKDKALILGRTDIVRETNILNLKLKKKNYDLHKVDSSTSATTKEKYKQTVMKSLIKYKAYSNEYSKLKMDYINGINMINKKLEPTITIMNDIGAVSSNVYGKDGIIRVGDSYKVALTLESQVTSVGVEIRDTISNTLVFSDSFKPVDGLHPSYTWDVMGSLNQGSYTLKFIYPELPGWEDIFKFDIVPAAPSDGVAISAVTPVAIALNVPQNVDIAAGSFKLYKFTPTVTNDYRIYTSPYAGTGAVNDTVLELYSDLAMTDLMYYSDDYETSFADIYEQPLIKGVSYYIKLYGWADASVHARITVANTVAFLAIPAFTSYVDISVPVNTSLGYATKIYKYLAATSGSFKVSTSIASRRFGGKNSDFV